MSQFAPLPSLVRVCMCACGEMVVKWKNPPSKVILFISETSDASVISPWRYLIMKWEASYTITTIDQYGMSWRYVNNDFYCALRQLNLANWKTHLLFTLDKNDPCSHRSSNGPIHFLQIFHRPSSCYAGGWSMDEIHHISPYFTMISGGNSWFQHPFGSSPGLWCLLIPWEEQKWHLWRLERWESQEVFSPSGLFQEQEPPAWGHLPSPWGGLWLIEFCQRQGRAFGLQVAEPWYGKPWDQPKSLELSWSCLGLETKKWPEVTEQPMIGKSRWHHPLAGGPFPHEHDHLTRLVLKFRNQNRVYRVSSRKFHDFHPKFHGFHGNFHGFHVFAHVFPSCFRSFPIKHPTVPTSSHLPRSSVEKALARSEVLALVSWTCAAVETWWKSWEKKNCYAMER